MTPKEIEIVVETIECIAAHFYARGQEDERAGKSLKQEEFKISKTNRLAIKTNLSKATNRR